MLLDFSGYRLLSGDSDTLRSVRCVRDVRTRNTVSDDTIDSDLYGANLEDFNEVQLLVDEFGDRFIIDGDEDDFIVRVNLDLPNFEGSTTLEFGARYSGVYLESSHSLLAPLADRKFFSTWGAAFQFINEFDSLYSQFVDSVESLKQKYR